MDYKDPEAGTNAYKLVPLDANQEHKWTHAKAAVQWACPSFAHLLYKMLNTDGSEAVLHFTKDIPTLATDGARIIANPDYFFGELTLPQQVAAVCHEIGHAMFHHCSMGYKFQQAGTITDGLRTEDYDPQQANWVMDWIINDMLHESHVGEIKKGWLHDKTKATYKDSWIDAYFRNYKKKPTPPQGQSGQDQHLAPGTSTGKDPNDPMVQPNPLQWQQAIAGAKAAAEAAGKLPGALGEVFDSFLTPVVDWTDHIKGIFARRVGGGSYDFRRPDRRLIIRDIVAPGRSGLGAGTVVLAIDTSGSIYAVPKLIERFMAEMAGLLEDVRPKKVIVMWVDTMIHRVDEVTEAGDVAEIRKLPVPGGGGTSFIEPFEYVTREGIEDVDALVYLTDGDGGFPGHEPEYPVIWGDISANRDKYPWGEVVTIPDDGTA